jgi:NAD(P)-dependent dehydrogenase (short-subunit alcohol dehydrogenase family)
VTGLCAGRVVVVTGAGRGLGRAHALAFAAEGARVVVNDVGAALDGSGGSTGPAAEVVAEIRAAGGEAVADGEDVADWAGAARLVAHAVEAFGRLDVLVNNAGILRDRMLVSLDEAEWDAVLRVHLKGHAAPLHHAAAYWRSRGKAGEPVAARVINTSSGAGLLGSVGQGSYSTAKAGILGLTLVAAAELARYGVTVNAVAPGFTETDMLAKVRPEVREKILAQIPLGRFGDPAEVAHATIFALENGYVTGTMINVNGGVYM